MTTTRIIGHTTLTLKQIAPSVSDAFSPNLHRWMRNKAHFYKGGGVRQTVYRVKPGTKLSKAIGADTGSACTAETAAQRARWDALFPTSTTTRAWKAQACTL
jgi:hypothetical protein